MKERMIAVDDRNKTNMMTGESMAAGQGRIFGTGKGKPGMRRLSKEEIKQLELELLLAFCALCEANHLYYTLGGGSLLGAVRHRGFIPWDDDIDVLMPRPDYDRLMNGKGLDFAPLPAYAGLSHFKDGSSYYPFMKLEDRRTLVEERYVQDCYACRHICIDIFPVDANPASSRELRRIYRLSLFYRKLLTLQMARKGEGKTLLKRRFKPFIQAGLQASLLRRFPVPELCRQIDGLAKRGSFEKAEYVGGIVWGYGPGERIQKSRFLTPVPMEFEGHLFQGPSNYHEYLTGLYGNYMILPPEKERQDHERRVFMPENPEQL